MNQVILLSGPPGAGKTFVAEALCERFDRMVHVEVDDLRHWVKAGYRHPWVGDRVGTAARGAQREEPADPDGDEHAAREDLERHEGHGEKLVEQAANHERKGAEEQVHGRSARNQINDATVNQIRLRAFNEGMD